MAPRPTPKIDLAPSEQDAQVAALQRRVARAIQRRDKQIAVLSQRPSTSSKVHDPPADLDRDQQDNDKGDDDRQPPPSKSRSTSRIGSRKGKGKQESGDDDDDRESGEEQDGDDSEEDSDGAEGEGDDEEDSEEGSEGKDDDAEGGGDDEDSDEGSEGKDDDAEGGGDDEDSEEGSEGKEGKDDNADGGGDDEESGEESGNEEVTDDEEADGDGDVKMGEGNEDEDDELEDRARAKGKLGKIGEANEGVKEGTVNSQAAKRTAGNKSKEREIRVRVVSPKKTTHVGDTTAPPNTCLRCFDSGTLCVRGTKAGSACTLCKKKKKKCVPNDARPPPADVKKVDTAPLPKRPLKKVPSVPATSQKPIRRPPRDLSRDSTAPLPQRAFKAAPSVPANSQNRNLRPPRHLSRYSTPAQSDEGPVVVVERNLLHVLSPPDSPPAKKRHNVTPPVLGGPSHETYAQVPSIPASPSPTPERYQTTLEDRLRRIEEMHMSLCERQTSTLAAVEAIHELLLGFMASRNERDSD